MKANNILLSFIGVAFTLITTTAEAIPAFARKYSTNCTSCHSAAPQLNKAGRGFKEAGYRFPELKGEKSISDFLHLDRYFPVSAIVKARPYDKKDSGDEKLRAIHEVELLVGGILYKNVSGFFELEAEDEDTNARGFEVGIPHATLTYNHSKAVNIQAAYAGLLAEDPYDTYSDSRRLTRGHASVLDQRNGGADNNGRLRDSRQALSVYGRPMDNIFYSVGITGVAGDSEGVNPDIYYGRLAVDVTPDIMVGLLGISGTCESSAANCAVNRDFTRYGIDAQADVADFLFMGSYLKSEDDDAAGTAETDNDAWYLQAQYIMKEKGRPTIVPLIRIDQYEQNNGVDEYSELTLNLSYYFTQNIRGFVEYWDQLDVPAGQTEDNRITLQLDASF